MLDSYGGYTNYTQNVVVTVAAPTDDFGPVGGSTTIDPTTPFVFTNVTDPSTVQQALGFTYYVSLDSGSYTSSNSATYSLPSDITAGTHTVSGYVEAQDGGISSTITWTETVTTSQVSVMNAGSGEMQLDWTGDSGSVPVDPGTMYVIPGTAPGLTITLETAGANYDIHTNGSIALITPASQSVTGVTLSVSTYVDSDTLDESVANGDVNEIDLLAGSTVSVNLRGDLGSIIGSDSNDDGTGVAAADLLFGNLTGSITGLDTICDMEARGWVGAAGGSSVVDVNSGIGNLSAFGVGANVNSDLAYNVNDVPMTLNVGTGGVPGTINAGKLADTVVQGIVNVLTVTLLQGGMQVKADAKVVKVKATDAANPKPLFFQSISGTLLFSKDADTVESLTVKENLNNMQVDGTLAVTGDVSLGTTGTITVGGSLAAPTISVGDTLGPTTVTRNLTCTTLTVPNITNLNVGGDLQGQIVMSKPPIGNIGDLQILSVGGDFTGSVGPANGVMPPAVGTITVKGSFTTPNGVTALVNAYTIDTILVTKNIGTMAPNGAGSGTITAQSSITKIESETRSIGLESITVGGNGFFGTIGQIVAKRGYLTAAVTDKDGNIGIVSASVITGNIKAIDDELGAKLSIRPSIGYVSAGSIGNKTNDLLIHADWGIGSITASNSSKQSFNVEAQCGIQFDKDKLTFGASPTVLQINVPRSQYLGTVSFTGGDNALRAANIVPTFAQGTKLFQLTYRPDPDLTLGRQITTSWTIKPKRQNTVGLTTTLTNVTFASNPGVNAVGGPTRVVVLKNEQLANNALEISN